MMFPRQDLLVSGSLQSRKVEVRTSGNVLNQSNRVQSIHPGKRLLERKPKSRKSITAGETSRRKDKDKRGKDKDRPTTSILLGSSASSQGNTRRQMLGSQRRRAERGRPPRAFWSDAVWGRCHLLSPHRPTAAMSLVPRPYPPRLGSLHQSGAANARQSRWRA